MAWMRWRNILGIKIMCHCPPPWVSCILQAEINESKKRVSSKTIYFSIFCLHTEAL